MIFSALYLCIAKQLLLISSLVLKAHIVLNISDVVQQTDSYSEIWGSNNFFYLLSKNELFYPKYHVRHLVVVTTTLHYHIQDIAFFQI